MESFTPAEYMDGAAADYRIIDVNPAGPTIPGVTYVDLNKVQGEMPQQGFWYGKGRKAAVSSVPRENVHICFRTG